MAELDFDKIEATIKNSVDGLERVLNSLSASGIKIAKTGTAGSQARTKKPETYLKDNPRRVVPKLYRDVTSEENSGTVRTILGAGLTAAGGIFSISTIGMIVSGVSAFSLIGTGFLAGLLLAGGLYNFFKGRKKKKLAQRFKEYVLIIGNKTVISVKELAKQTGYSESEVLEDLREMIRLRWFTQGHMDNEGKELITSDDTYKNYLMLLERQPELMAQQEQQMKAEGLEGFTSEGAAIVRQGEEYLKKIQQMNAELPGVEITEKLQRLESVIRSILYEVRKQPGSATDLRKLMNYYLPTIWKLLETYKEIDDQVVVTEQMQKTRLEIEETIDTINNAFENLLEQLFRNKAWDVSSDISVLNTMLAQDGIKDTAFNINQVKEEVQ
ncbi:MAG: 5-bromo-4-chloroindolyl phosphate hydrolysis family protein [Lachnospiraceae bacterium]|nr:5-bromo-4-chloroindolyl phosphate hydrolysis family protein [Lachnospiraceae bacterium]